MVDYDLSAYLIGVLWTMSNLTSKASIGAVRNSYDVTLRSACRIHLRIHSDVSFRKAQKSKCVPGYIVL